MSTYYTVPQANGSISTVRSAVLANGVALLFLYIVTSFSYRLTMALKYLSLLYSIVNQKTAIRSSRDCWKPLECYICSLSQVILFVLSDVFDISSILLWSSLRHTWLDYTLDSCLTARLLRLLEIL